ncbi:Cation efflux system protein CzcA [Sphingobacterium multivorum]|uniref:efflux RND transporter permease subunit n=1 Tax=Sphingobacterium multivorum TaxID=28454 RepID=UPI000E04C9E3|nr:efflux RND transporter permease subunit [Sphingobacterium multivorum]QQT46638.1 efflux RND transporter permease subunit [Sphingobacterium multivorum]SUJ89310.1 Cation efflux system protein CzcA [Sphingobacterium multivorum]
MEHNKEHKGLIALAMKYNKIVLLVISTLVLCGVFALFKMPKQEFPVFTIRQGVVVGVYPGATSAEVEEQLAKPLEKFLFTIKEVKKNKTYSQSRDGIVYVFVELNDDVNNKDEVWSKIKHGLSTFKMQLPSGVLALIANDDFGDTSALLIALESDTKTYRQLKDYVEALEDKLRGVESVSNLRRYGVQNEQLSIYIDKEKVASYGINIYSLYQTLLTKGMIGPAGTIDNDEMVVPIHITRPFASERELEEQIVYSDPTGNHIRLKDVAQVVREYPEASSYTTSNGKKCLILSTEMREGYNIVEYGKDVEVVLKDFEKTLPDDVKVFRIADQPQVVDASINTFLKELAIAIIAVVIVTMIFLPIRVAGVAASTIPVSIFISLALMFAFGIELNTVTLAALVVVLGMIVDNSIVIVDSYLEKLDEGIPRWEASIESAQEYFKAILSATLAIGITFFPFLITLTGQFYDFVRAFPWTILITLSVSLAVAVLFVPYMQYFLVKKGLHSGQNENAKKSKSFLDYVQFVYDKTLEKVFQFPKISLVSGVLIALFGVVMFLNLPLKLMPVAERNQFAVEIFLPQASSLEQTEKVANDMSKILGKDKRVKSITTFMGSGSPRFQTTYVPKIGGSNFAQFIVNTESNEATEEMLDEYANKYAHYYPNAFVKFKQLDYQVGVDADVEVRLSGSNIADLKEAAGKLQSEIGKMDEPIRIYTNYEEILPDIRVALDPVESNRLGITEGVLGVGLATRFGGMPITTIWENDYQIPVLLKSKWEHKDPVAGDVENEYISGLFSPAVPLRQVAKISTGWNEGQIVRRNGVRTLSVYVDLKRGEKVDAMQSKIEDLVAGMQSDMNDKNISVAYGGVQNLNDETIPKIVKALIGSVAIIFFILVFHFKNVSLASLVFASTSFSIFGAAFGIWIMGLDFSITAVLGLVSLIGIIVRNGIIMYDYIEELRHKHNTPILEACLEAGRRRMRPILLTCLAASMGVIPMIISKSPLWCPMGSVICFGTLISMIFILTMLPLMYWLAYKNQDKKNEVL